MVQYSQAVQHARLDSIESTIGTSAVLKILTGSAPANCAAADSGSVLVSMTLPSDWAAAASGGTKAKSGTWSGTASGTGTAGYYRIYASNGTTCHQQGPISELGLDNTSIASGQTVTINTATWDPAND